MATDLARKSDRGVARNHAPKTGPAESLDEAMQADLDAGWNYPEWREALAER
jgi:hypothetical protein